MTEALQADFVEAVVQEIALRADNLRDKVIENLAFRWGTPSLLTARQLEKLIRALHKLIRRFWIAVWQVSIEATPESVDREKFLGYRQAGINRVNMGVQSLVDAEVALANRLLPGLSSFELLRGAVERLRSVGIPDVVIDLMIGIEGQTIESFRTHGQQGHYAQARNRATVCFGLKSCSDRSGQEETDGEVDERPAPLPGLRNRAKSIYACRLPAGLP